MFEPRKPEPTTRILVNVYSVNQSQITNKNVLYDIPVIILKKLLYYITDHGLGHTTRSVAIIRELLKIDIEVIIRNSNIDYLHKSLPTVKTISGLTDVGPTIKQNGISIDHNKTLENITKWITSLPSVADNEYKLIEKKKPDLIISDISAMPFLAAHKASIPSIAISNFSWNEVLTPNFGNQMTKLTEAYELANFAIQLPFGTRMNSFKNKRQVGLVCKKPTESKKIIRRKLGLKESDVCLFVTLGKYFKIKVTAQANVKVISTGAKIDFCNVKYIEPWIEGQNLIAASDLVICKCGYGMISECLTNGVPFLYVSDDTHLEQKAISDKLVSMGLCNRIFENELNDFTLSNYYNSKIGYRKINNDSKTVVEIVEQFIKS